MYTKPVHKIAKAKRHQTELSRFLTEGGEKSGGEKSLVLLQKKQIFPVKNPA